MKADKKTDTEISHVTTARSNTFEAEQYHLKSQERIKNSLAAKETNKSQILLADPDTKLFDLLTNGVANIESDGISIEVSVFKTQDGAFLSTTGEIWGFMIYGLADLLASYLFLAKEPYQDIVNILATELYGGWNSSDVSRDVYLPFYNAMLGTNFTMEQAEELRLADGKKRGKKWIYFKYIEEKFLSLGAPKAVRKIYDDSVKEMFPLTLPPTDPYCVLFSVNPDIHNDYTKTGTVIGIGNLMTLNMAIGVEFIIAEDREPWIKMKIHGSTTIAGIEAFQKGIKKYCDLALSKHNKDVALNGKESSLLLEEDFKTGMIAMLYKTINGYQHRRVVRKKTMLVN